ncbi:MAG: hypothetical protein HUJ26_15970 [Planctomycetaceae bacterium]|nr:hypothetical protein [Planctomycetaceae bacterium]
MWTIWWNSDRAQVHFDDYWDAPIFYPVEDTFAFSEPQPMTVVVAPVIWLTGSRVLGYNLYLAISLLLNGLLATRLLRQISIHRLVAAAGGIFVILLPMIHLQKDSLQLIPVWGVLWFWSTLLKIDRSPTAWRGAELGLAFSVVVFCSIHHALFLLILTLGTCWLSASHWTKTSFYRALVIGLLVAGVMSGPFLWRMRTVMVNHHFLRSIEKVQQLSAVPSDYLKTPGRLMVDPFSIQRRPSWKLGTGTGRLVLALAGCVLGLIHRKRRRVTLFLFSLSAFAFILSLGMNLQMRDWNLWLWLSSFPGVSQVRSPFRFSYFVQLGVALLAALGLHELWILVCRYWWRARTAILPRCLLALLAILVAFESSPRKITLASVPDHNQHQDWIRWLIQNADSKAGAVCLPMSPGNLVQDFDITVRWMYFGSYHKVPLLNGYSGYFPDEYFDARNQLNSEFPSLRTLDSLRKKNIRYVIIDHSSDRSPTTSRMNEFNSGVKMEYHSATGISIYRINDR